MANQITPNPSVPTQVVAEVKFPRFINNLGIIPTSYKDSMSYYECLAWLCKFLEETVIPSVNENGEAVEELQNLYVELNSYVTDYFTNLDIQEEINNKLDEMVEDGTLQEIVADYLNSKAVFGYDTVSAMKSSTNLIDGSFARTLGYYQVNDDGNALYKIRTITNEDVIDEMFIIALNSQNLIAELIIQNNTINLKALGLTYTNTSKNISIINRAISKVKKEQNLFIPSGTYEFEDTINLLKFPSYANFICEGVLKYKGDGIAIKCSNNYSHIYISELLSDYNDYSELDDSNIIGIQINSSGTSNYEFNAIKGFKKAIEMIGIPADDTHYYYDGCLYNTISCNYINAYIGCYITKQGGYVNETIFRLKWLDCYNGIEFLNNDSYNDYFNNNKFYNLGLENIANVGIILNGCRHTLIESPRFENAGSYYITEDSTSSGNMFLLNYGCNADKLQLNGIRSVVLGNRYAENGDVLSQLSLCGYNSNEVNVSATWSSNLKNNTIYFENDNGVIFNENFCRVKRSNGTVGIVPFQDITSNETAKFINTNGTLTRKNKVVCVATNESAITLTCSADMQQNGYYYILSVITYANPITLAKANGAASGSISAGGTYIALYAGDYWQVVKISDGHFYF